jgi:uracil-DNA glycosylase family 4
VDPRTEAIAALTRQLRPPEELGGVFLPRDASPQFDLMFLAEMPSRREPKENGRKLVNFNFDASVGARDRFLRDMMLKYGVGGSYVTDIVKRRAVPRRQTRAEILTWLPFLLEEIAIIRPKALVVLGKRTYEQSYLPHVASRIKDDIPVDYVFHYSNQVPREKFEQRFALVIHKLRQMLRHA